MFVQPRLTGIQAKGFLVGGQRALVLRGLEKLVAPLDFLLGLDLVATREADRRQEKQGGRGRTMPMAWHASLSLLRSFAFAPGLAPGLRRSAEFC